MRTSIRIVTLVTVFLFAIAASHAYGGTKATRSVSASNFIFNISLTTDGPATLEFGVADNVNVPYPPIGTPADTSLKHIFFIGSGDAALGQAADYSQLACCYLSGETPLVWKLQSLADTTIYFSMKEGDDPQNLTIGDGESEPKDLRADGSFRLTKGTTYFIRPSNVTINPIGTIRTAMLKGSTALKVPFPKGYTITPDVWKNGKTNKVFAFTEDGAPLFTINEETALPIYEGEAFELSSLDLTTNQYTIANLPENAAYFQFGFDYADEHGTTLSSLVVVDVTDPIAVTLTSIEYGAYDKNGDVAVEDDKPLSGTADPASTRVLPVPATIASKDPNDDNSRKDPDDDNSRDSYVKMEYTIVTSAVDGPSNFNFFVDCLPVTELYTVVTDAESPFGATRIEDGNGGSFQAAKSGNEYTFTGMNLPAGTTATLTVVLKVEEGAIQTNVTPTLIIAGNEWPLTSLYILPEDAGTLDIDGNGVVNEEDALMFYLFVALGGVDDPDGMYVDDIIQGIEETVVDAEAALDLMKGLPTFLDYDGNGTITEEDALMMYLFIALGGVDDPDGMYVDDIIQGIDETMVDAETALETFKKLARK